MIATLALLLPALGSCRCGQDEAPPRTKAAEPGSSPDRLAPGEQLPGRERVFGIEVPEGLTVASRFPEVAQLSGHVKLESALSALQKQLEVEHIQLGTQRATFPRATVKGDTTKRLLRVELVSVRGRLDVNIRDITAEPAPEGLEERERWDRAGRNPDGTLKDRLKVY